MLGIFVWALVSVAGVAAHIEDDAHRRALGATGYDLLRIGGWGFVIVGGLMAFAIALGVPMRAREKAASPRAAAHPLYTGWPPTRLDIFSVLAFGVVAFAAVEREWVMVGVALFAVLIAALLPRMEGAFKLGGPVPLEGILRDEPSQLEGIGPDAGVAGAGDPGF